MAFRFVELPLTRRTKALARAAGRGTSKSRKKQLKRARKRRLAKSKK